MRILYYFFAFILLTSCGTDGLKTDSTKVLGKVKYAKSGYIYLDILTPNGYAKVDSSKLDDEKSFQLETNTSEENIYRINFFNQQKNTFVSKDQDLFVEADGISEMGRFSVKGSDAALAISRVNQIKHEHEISKGLLGQKMRTASANKDAFAIDSLKNEYAVQEHKYLGKLQEVMDLAEGSLASLLILTENFDLEPNLALYGKHLQLMENNIGDHWLFNEISNQFENIKRTAIGSVAPDFSLGDPDGNLILLSSFRGKYLFVDFWASWCQPCRIENPELVKVYEKFKGPKFEILGISFDKRKERWVQAIKKDGLLWPQVSDLKYLDSEMVELYNITNVPMTFLLDPEGKIIAKNIHADELENILAELL